MPQCFLCTPFQTTAILVVASKKIMKQLLLPLVAAMLLVASCTDVISASSLLVSSAQNLQHHHDHNNAKQGSSSSGSPPPRPVALLHGLLGTCEAMSHIKGWLEADFPGIHVHNIEIADCKNKFDSLLINMNDQVEIMHKKLQSDPVLAKGGFVLIGHSQGGLLTRAYIQRYGHVYSTPIHTYISLAGPHQGVYGVPDVNDICPPAECPWLDNIMDDLATGKATEAFFQKYISFAQYWKDVLNKTAYLSTSGFIADINNEREQKNTTYRRNLMAVSKIVLLHALEDHIVVPSMSELFGMFAWGQDKVVLNMTQTEGYQGDWLGLKTLSGQGKLHLHSVECTHQNMPRPKCKAVVYDAYIKPNI